MKITFERALHSFNEAAKDKLNDQGNKENLGHALDWLINKATYRFGTDKETQKSIFDLQVKKQQVMLELKKRLSEIDKPPQEVGEQREGVRRVVKTDNGYIWLKNKDKKKVTLGELMTDGEWGVEYDLDPETVPRVVRRRYLVERAKHELQQFADEQIILNEKSSQYVHEFKRDTYGRIERDRKDKSVESKAGLVAERMVRNFLKKVVFDLGGKYRLLEVDVYQDVQQKMDFIIRRPAHDRGVKVESSEENIGVQFTISQSEHTKREKTKQIDRARHELGSEDKVRDIVLISLPLEDVLEKFTLWSEKKSAGGPDKLWSREQKQQILRGILRNFLPPQEIEELSGRV